MNTSEREEYEDELDQLSMKYLAAKNRAEKLINGPGGIMEMKQTIADKEKEIEYLKADLRFWKERFSDETTTLHAEIERLQKNLDLVYQYDSNLVDHLKGWK
jgi:predicted  nucleic acid-binding Zn-ribbon protein